MNQTLDLPALAAELFDRLGALEIIELLAARLELLARIETDGQRQLLGNLASDLRLCVERYETEGDTQL